MPAATESEIKGYFAAMLLAGSVAVATKKVGTALDIPALDLVSAALIFGAALLVSGAVVTAGYCNVREGGRQRWCELGTA